MNLVDPSGLSFLKKISQGAYDILNWGSGGALDDIACNGLNWGNGLKFGLNIGVNLLPGGAEVRGGKGVAESVGGIGRLPWRGYRPHAPNRDLPRYPGGRPKPESPYPHTQLGTRKGAYPQSREFDGNGRPVRDIDWTDHGNPDWHTDPHQHVYGPKGSRGGPGSVWP